MVTKCDVFRLLADFGIRHSDKVTVHSALRAVGEIEGGADGLIDAMCQYLHDGLLLIPTHTWDNFVLYDVKKSIPCLGALSKVAAFRPDAVRSLHPTHSVAAFGKDAKQYVKGEEKATTPTSINSCLSRLYEENGKILLIGVGHKSNTFLHAVEERLNIPNRISPKTYTITIKDYEGKEFQSMPFHPFGSVGIPGGASEYFENYKKPLEYTKAVTYSTLGNARVYCCDAKKTVETIQALWKKADYDLCAGNKEIPEEYYV